MKRLIMIIALTATALTAMAWHSVKSPDIKGLEVITNDDMEALPILRLGSGDRMKIGFDELSHNYHRYTYRLEPCNPDWTATEGLFESDWLVGFNDLPIEDYVNSLNTTTLYTHYEMEFPNSECRLKMSGNYRLHIVDEDGTEAVTVELRVVEPLMNVGLSVSSNTELGLNTRYQQVSMTVVYNGLQVTRPDEQIQTFVMQNGREDNMKANVRPNQTTPTSLRWEYNRALVFDGGNEYHKFEVLDPRHPTMGIASTRWDDDTRTWHAWPMTCEPRKNYLYDEDANGAFLLRNSDNFEAERTSEYVYIHFRLQPARHYEYAQVVVSGRWATEEPSQYVMTYDEANQSYDACILQKLGYYNYQILLRDLDGTTHALPEEGSFFETENTYQALVYYKGTGERAWRLVGFQEVRYS